RDLLPKNLSQPRGNHCSVRLTRSVRRSGGYVHNGKNGSNPLVRKTLFVEVPRLVFFLEPTTFWPNLLLDLDLANGCGLEAGQSESWQIVGKLLFERISG